MRRWIEAMPEVTALAALVTMSLFADRGKRGGLSPVAVRQDRRMQRSCGGYVRCYHSARRSPAHT